MTLPPSRTGEVGLRYEIRWLKKDDPPGGFRELGVASNLRDARAMRSRWWLNAPDVVDCWIVDLETRKRVA